MVFHYVWPTDWTKTCIQTISSDRPWCSHHAHISHFISESTCYRYLGSLQCYHTKKWFHKQTCTWSLVDLPQNCKHGHRIYVCLISLSNLQITLQSNFATSHFCQQYMKVYDSPYHHQLTILSDFLILPFRYALRDISWFFNCTFFWVQLLLGISP